MELRDMGMLQDGISKQEVLDALHAQVRHLMGHPQLSVLCEEAVTVVKGKVVLSDDPSNPVAQVLRFGANMAGWLLAGGGIVENGEEDERIEQLVLRQIYEAVTDCSFY